MASRLEWIGGVKVNGDAIGRKDLFGIFHFSFGVRAEIFSGWEGDPVPAACQFKAMKSFSKPNQTGRSFT